MASHRGTSRARERVVGPVATTTSHHHHRPLLASTNKNQEVVLTLLAKDKGLRKTQKRQGQVLSPCRSCALSSDNVSLETEGTGISTLTSTSGEHRSHQHLPGNCQTLHKMPPALYTPTIYEDATQSSYISRPIDVDSMQEYEEEDVDLKPARLDLDDSQSRATESTFSSRPIDVDSVMEYDPEEYPDSKKIPDDRFEKIMDFNSQKGYYEGESLLEYSSDDESVDFETGLMADSRKERPGQRVVSLKNQQASPPAQQMPRSVDVVGPIYLNTSYLVSGAEDESTGDVEVSFQDWEFPIVEDTYDRELVGYMEGFEPLMEDLAPRRHGRKPSDATSTRSSNNPRSISTRVTFEI
mmetsp:Transcript_10233/g.19638  ORF Transcript_10233/g.19638 Transcript_10233/m.19638 type:complete len:354 (+) Transcript_10233:14-1075(+)